MVRKEGFWRLDKAPGENTMPWEEMFDNVPVSQDEVVDPNIVQALDEAESRASMESYYGCSMCRVCGCSNGGNEFLSGSGHLAFVIIWSNTAFINRLKQVTWKPGFSFRPPALPTPFLSARNLSDLPTLSSEFPGQLLSLMCTLLANHSRSVLHPHRPMSGSNHKSYASSDVVLDTA